ncbi:MAG: hypothetical protein JXQ84_04080, partial [Rhodospirillaceae bacterium]|nr:hypothetical protein [Rhodospirillaceae bacterium]
MPTLKKPIQISRPGRHTATNGATLEFTDTTCADVAAVYDPAVHQAPLVVGHPKTDDPAYGWVQGLAFADGILQVTDVDQLDAAFADLVNAGRFKTVSASFYLPQSPNHPKPGHLYLKHVGFLGAAAPAVKGLKPVSFADDAETLTVEFAQVDGWTLAGAFTAIGNLLSGMRDFLIESQGAEKADALLPRGALDHLQATAERVRQQADNKEPAFADPLNPKETSMDETELKTRAADLAKREAAITAQEAAFADQARQGRRRDNEALVDQLIKDGRFVATHKAETLAFMDSLDATTATIDFADADGKPGKLSQLAAYRVQLQAGPKLVEFGEIGGGVDPVDTMDFATPQGSVVDRDR